MYNPPKLQKMSITNNIECITRFGNNTHITQILFFINHALVTLKLAYQTLLMNSKACPPEKPLSMKQHIPKYQLPLFPNIFHLGKEQLK